MVDSTFIADRVHLLTAAERRELALRWVSRALRVQLAAALLAGNCAAWAHAIGDVELHDAASAQQCAALLERAGIDVAARMATDARALALRALDAAAAAVTALAALLQQASVDGVGLFAVAQRVQSVADVVVDIFGGPGAHGGRGEAAEQRRDVTARLTHDDEGAIHVATRREVRPRAATAVRPRASWL